MKSKHRDLLMLLSSTFITYTPCTRVNSPGSATWGSVPHGTCASVHYRHTIKGFEKKKEQRSLAQQAWPGRIDLAA